MISNLSEIKKNISEMGADPRPSNEKCTPVDTAEIMERVRRSHNIIIRNVQESNAVEQDTITVNQIFDHIIPQQSHHVISISRIGTHSPPKNRPILVSFSNPSIVKKILRNKKLLKLVDSFRAISLSDDLTPNQSNYLRELRDRLRHRLQQGETDLTIKFLKGVPTIVSQTPSADSGN